MFNIVANPEYSNNNPPERELQSLNREELCQKYSVSGEVLDFILLSLLSCHQLQEGD